MTLLQTFGGVRRHQQAVRAGGIGGPAMEGRVQFVEFLVADAGDLGPTSSIWPSVATRAK